MLSMSEFFYVTNLWKDNRGANFAYVDIVTTWLKCATYVRFGNASSEQNMTEDTNKDSALLLTVVSSKLCVHG